MKQLLFGLLMPLLGYGQTIHFEEDKILYEGRVNLALYSQDEIRLRLQKTLPLAAEEGADAIRIQTSDSSLQAVGQIKLKAPYHLIRRIQFALQFIPEQGGYRYKVDSVSLTEGRRGWKRTVTPAAELLEGLEETGMAEIETEMLLNEIDLRIQKLLKVLENQMRTSGAEQAGKTASSSGKRATASQ